MKFIKDILFFDMVTTGPNSDKDSIMQLSGVLLDKDNLLERANFNSYVRGSYLDSIIQEHAKFLQIEPAVYKRSPKIYDVAKQFYKKFGSGVLLGTHTWKNVLFLKNAFKKAVIPFDYDEHAIELWTLGYIYTLNYGMRKMPTFYTFLDYFKLKQEKPNDALEKARLGAEIFRKIVKEV